MNRNLVLQAVSYILHYVKTLHESLYECMVMNGNVTGNGKVKIYNGTLKMELNLNLKVCAVEIEFSHRS